MPTRFYGSAVKRPQPSPKIEARDKCCCPLRGIGRRPATDCSGNTASKIGVDVLPFERILVQNKWEPNGFTTVDLKRRFQDICTTIYIIMEEIVKLIFPRCKKKALMSFFYSYCKLKYLIIHSHFSNIRSFRGSTCYRNK